MLSFYILYEIADGRRKTMNYMTYYINIIYYAFTASNARTLARPRVSV